MKKDPEEANMEVTEYVFPISEKEANVPYHYKVELSSEWDKLSHLLKIAVHIQ